MSSYKGSGEVSPLLSPGGPATDRFGASHLVPRGRHVVVDERSLCGVGLRMSYFPGCCWCIPGDRSPVLQLYRLEATLVWQFYVGRCWQGWSFVQATAVSAPAVLRLVHIGVAAKAFGRCTLLLAAR